MSVRSDDGDKGVMPINNDQGVSPNTSQGVSPNNSNNNEQQQQPTEQQAPESSQTDGDDSRALVRTNFNDDSDSEDDAMAKRLVAMRNTRRQAHQELMLQFETLALQGEGLKLVNEQYADHLLGLEQTATLLQTTRGDFDDMVQQQHNRQREYFEEQEEHHENQKELLFKNNKIYHEARDTMQETEADLERNRALREVERQEQVAHMAEMRAMRLQDRREHQEYLQSRQAARQNGMQQQSKGATSPNTTSNNKGASSPNPTNAAQPGLGSSKHAPGANPPKEKTFATTAAASAGREFTDVTRGGYSQRRGGASIRGGRQGFNAHTPEQTEADRQRFARIAEMDAYKRTAPGPALRPRPRYQVPRIPEEIPYSDQGLGRHLCRTCFSESSAECPAAKIIWTYRLGQATPTYPAGWSLIHFIAHVDQKKRRDFFFDLVDTFPRLDIVHDMQVKRMAEHGYQEARAQEDAYRTANDALPARLWMNITDMHERLQRQGPPPPRQRGHSGHPRVAEYESSDWVSQIKAEDRRILEETKEEWNRKHGHEAMPPPW